jgi:hypothetical protein
MDWRAKAIFDSVGPSSLNYLGGHATTYDGAAGHGIRRRNLHRSRGDLAGILIVWPDRFVSGGILAPVAEAGKLVPELWRTGVGQSATFCVENLG